MQKRRFWPERWLTEALEPQGQDSDPPALKDRMEGWMPACFLSVQVRNKPSQTASSWEHPEGWDCVLSCARSLRLGE